MIRFRLIVGALNAIGPRVRALTANRTLKGLSLAFASVLGALSLTMMSACDQIATSIPQVGAQPTPRTETNVVFTGSVVGVTDGDTLTMLDEQDQQHVIRLAEIDAPERSQPWGNRSRQTLAELTFGKTVSVRQTDTDRYGRIVGRVFAGGEDVSQAMVEQGAAWAYRQYLTDETLIATEVRARRQGVGLWSIRETQTVPPWAWRKGVRVGSVEVPDREQATAAFQSVLTPMAPLGGGGKANGQFTCAGKRVCRQMTSCAEANYYLRQCGLESLDGNGDGQPCELLCGTTSR